MGNQRFSRLASQCNCHNTPFAPNNIAKRPNHEKTGIPPLFGHLSSEKYKRLTRLGNLMFLHMKHRFQHTFIDACLCITGKTDVSFI